MGGAIRVVYSFLEESYEPMSSIRSLAYRLGKEQVSAFRHYSNLRFDSFCHLGRIRSFGITVSLCSLLLPLGRRTQRDLPQLRFDPSSILGTWANGQMGGMGSSPPRSLAFHRVLFFPIKQREKRTFLFMTFKRVLVIFTAAQKEAAVQIPRDVLFRFFRLYGFTLLSSLGDFDGRKLADDGILFVLCTTPAAVFFGGR